MCKAKGSNPVTIIFIGIAISLFFFYLFLETTRGREPTLNDAEISAHRYCYMVFTGQWPDYQQNYGKFCIAEKWNGK